MIYWVLIVKYFREKNVAKIGFFEDTTHFLLYYAPRTVSDGIVLVTRDAANSVTPSTTCGIHTASANPKIQGDVASNTEIKKSGVLS